MKKHFVNLFVAVMVLVSSSAMAEENSIVKLQSFLQKMALVEAKFVQHNYDGKGSILQTMKGILLAKKPGKFRWETEDPYHQLLVTDGETLWLFDQDLEQVTIQPLDKRVIATPALMFTGAMDQIGNAYEVYAEQMDAEWHFVLIPKNADVLFDRLRLEFDSQQLISRMIIKDEVGQKTVLTFKDVVVKESIADDLFTFVPPEGVDVIQNAHSQSEN